MFSFFGDTDKRDSEKQNLIELSKNLKSRIDEKSGNITVVPEGAMTYNEMRRWGFSQKEMERLKYADVRLQILAFAVAQFHPCFVIFTYRDYATQDSLFRKGVTKVRGGGSHHNAFPSNAIDLAPKNISSSKAFTYEERNAYLFTGRVLTIADLLFGEGVITNIMNKHKSGLYVREDGGFLDPLHFEITPEYRNVKMVNGIYPPSNIRMPA